MSAFTVKAFTGEDVVLDVAPEATALFGFHHGERVRYTKGRHNGREAIVLGVGDGMLWFKFADEDDKGTDLTVGARTMSMRCREEILRQHGWVSLE